MLCAFIEGALKHMVSNLPMDHYTLVLDPIPDSLQVRAIATNSATQLTVETQLRSNQVRDLLMHPYGREQTIIEYHIEELVEGHKVEVLATSKDLCLFTPHELSQCGFDPKELEV